MRILILTIKAESDSGRGGKIIKEYIENKVDSAVVEIVDFGKYINPVLDKLIMKGFIKELRKLNLYNNLLPSRKDQETIERFNELLFDLLWIKLKEIIDEFKGDVIVSTHPFYLEMMKIIYSRWKIDTPVIAVLCDFKASKSWIHDYVSAYVVPHEYFKPLLVKDGAEAKIIYPYGIPFSPGIPEPVDRLSVLKKIGLEDRETVVIDGTCPGVGPVKEMVYSLARSSSGLQIIAVTGFNAGFKEEIEKIAKISGKKIKTIEYRDFSHEIMGAADLFITRGGGVHLSQALSMGIPSALICPIRGEKEIGLHHLLKLGAVYLLENAGDTSSVISLLKDKEKLRQLKVNGASVSKPHAAIDIANLIWNMARGSSISKNTPN